MSPLLGLLERGCAACSPDRSWGGEGGSFPRRGVGRRRSRAACSRSCPSCSSRWRSRGADACSAARASRAPRRTRRRRRSSQRSRVRTHGRRRAHPSWSRRDRQRARRRARRRAGRSPPRGQLPRRRRSPARTRYYLCRDGSTSPSCVCGQKKNGCCSHHGGVAGCEP
jgi:hypothetical protein